jgi:hypothetical protein
MRTPTCRVLKLVSAFVNVTGRDRVLNSGPLSRRPDKSTTSPRSDTVIYITFLKDYDADYLKWIATFKKYYRISIYGRCRRRMSHHRPTFRRFWRNGYFCTHNDLELLTVIIFVPPLKKTMIVVFLEQPAWAQTYQGIHP